MGRKFNFLHLCVCLFSVVCSHFLTSNLSLSLNILEYSRYSKRETFLLHNKLPVKEWLFRIGLRHDPYCLKCAGAVVSDIVHFFCSCGAVCDTWSWVKGQVVQWGQMGAGVDDLEIVNLFFVNSCYDREKVWLVSSYIHHVWEMVQAKKQEVRLDKFFGFLTFKYRMHQTTSHDQLQNLHYTYI